MPFVIIGNQYPLLDSLKIFYDIDNECIFEIDSQGKNVLMMAAQSGYVEVTNNIT